MISLITQFVIIQAPIRNSFRVIAHIITIIVIIIVVNHINTKVCRTVTQEVPKEVCTPVTKKECREVISLVSLCFPGSQDRAINGAL